MIDNNGEGIRIPSFAELEEREAVAPTELLLSLQEYAEGGWAISSDVVIGLAERTEMRTGDFTSLGHIAHHGMRMQFYNHAGDTARKEAAEYHEVLLYARAKITEIAINN